MSDHLREGALWPSVLLPDGREVTIYPLTYGRARLVVGEVGAPWYDDGY